MSLLLFVNRFICIIFQIPHISGIIWYLSFSDFTQYDNSSSICVTANGIIALFIRLSSIPCIQNTSTRVSMCIFMSHLYPSVYRWPFTLFPYLGYCKQCCYESLHFLFIMFLLKQNPQTFTVPLLAQPTSHIIKPHKGMNLPPALRPSEPQSLQAQVPHPPQRQRRVVRHNLLLFLH